jgi:signal transduction histidine kinase/ActR/RegA family two-component response regulator
MDRFEITSEPGAGTTVVLQKAIPKRMPSLDPQQIAKITTKLRRMEPRQPLDELQRQNQELIRLMEELRARQEDLERLNTELEDTNRGVLALYAELDERADRLRRADQMKSQFLSHMSHEFRTPLNSILALCRLLLDRADGPLTPEQEKQVVYVRKSAENLYELVNDLLDLAKVEAGKTDVKAAEFLVSSLFGALRGVLKPVLSNPAVNLLFDEPEELPPLYTDEGKISQILRNFISNSLKFTERGEVRVSATLSADGQEISFCVSDTGIGIAPEHLELIFQEFAQIDSAVQRRVRGTGLGLPLSRKLAELLGGNVSVDSTPGCGSTFMLRVPRVYPCADGSPASVQANATSAIRVLLIDDEDVSRYLIRQSLTGFPAEFIEASSASEGLRRAREALPDVILLDVLMPDMSGMDVLPVLKKDPPIGAIPVIVVTSKVLTETERGIIAADAFSIVSKEILTRPDAGSLLQAEIRRALETARVDESVVL